MANNNKIKDLYLDYSVFEHAIYKFTGGKKKRHFYIPDAKKESVWLDIYKKLSALSQPPIHNSLCKIVKNFGHFGPRIHPVNKKPHFHLGIDISDKIGTPIFPIIPGFLYYSGFHPRNGNYVILEHPQIQTKDKATLFSLYMHLDSCAIKFQLWKKLLRVLSKKFRQQQIDLQTIIGYLGKTGNAEKLVPHLHLQIEFHSPKKKILVLNPEQIFGYKH